jgi:multidrug resistance efflux pump
MWWLAALLTSACAAKAEGPGDVPTIVVGEPATFVREVRAEGLLRAAQATPVVTPQDANGPMKIAWVAVDGVAVAEGDVVVRFDPSEMERRLADSKDDVTVDERQIGKVTIETTATKRRRDRSAKLSVHEADVARALRVDDETILSRNEIAENTIDLELAEAKVDHARGVQAVERQVASSQLELHQISRGHHEKSVAHAKQSLQQLEVTAPHAGILVLSRDWRGSTMRVGDTAWPGQQIAELPVITKLEAEVFVLEADAGDLAAGLTADVVIDAQPEMVWKAKIDRVDTLAQPKHPEVPVHYFGVKLALEQTDTARMRVGQRVRATIRIERENVIVVPRQAVFEDGGLTVVYRRGTTGFEPVEVELGAASAGRVVITKGLEPGEHIALRDPSRAASELLADSDGDAKAGGGDE